MESFAKRLTNLSKAEEKHLLKIRDLTINKKYPILKATKHANNFGGFSVRLDLEGGAFVYLPDRIANKLTEADVQEINDSPLKLAVKYTGESEVRFFGKTVANVAFETV